MILHKFFFENLNIFIIVVILITNLERFRKRGFEAMLVYYEKAAPHLN